MEKLKKKILVTGVFDLLHQEHINFLNKAKQEGEVLVVGVESDVRVKELKGSGRPVNNQRQRLKEIKRLGLADQAFILPEKFISDTDHLRLLNSIKPDVLAVSSHTPHLDKKRQLMKQIGGEVKVVYDQNPAVSTTTLLAEK